MDFFLVDDKYRGKCESDLPLLPWVGHSRHRPRRTEHRGGEGDDAFAGDNKLEYADFLVAKGTHHDDDAYSWIADSILHANSIWTPDSAFFVRLIHSYASLH